MEVKSIAICQASPVPNNVSMNRTLIIKWMERAAREGAHLAVFGELFLTDYELDNPVPLSETKDGESARIISEAAKRIGIAVVYGYSEVDEGKYYNSIKFIDREGQEVANFRKVHVWPTERKYYSAGNEAVVVDWEGFRVGLGICADVCFPEFVTGMVANEGANLIIVSSALADPPLYERTPKILLPARALENRCFLVYADLVGKKYSGMSRIYDPMGDVMAASQPGVEEVIMAKVDVAQCQQVPFKYNPLRRTDVYNQIGKK